MKIRNPIQIFSSGDIMIVEAWFDKAEKHLEVCEIFFDVEDYSGIVNSCFLGMFSAMKALLALKNIECKTHEGLIYLFKIHYVDNGLFDRNLFGFYCRTKELNTEFFRLNFDVFDEKTAVNVFLKSQSFVDYSRDFAKKHCV